MPQKRLTNPHGFTTLRDLSMMINHAEKTGLFVPQDSPVYHWGSPTKPERKLRLPFQLFGFRRNK